MKIKPVLRFFEFSSMALMLGLLLAVLAILFARDSAATLIFGLLVAASLVLSFFTRKSIVSRILRKSRYPGAWYSVMDKLGMTDHLGIFLSDELLNEIYQPSYTTEQFLADNQLKTEYGAARNFSNWDVVVSVIGLAALLSLVSRFSFGKRSLVFLLPAFVILLTLYFWFRGVTRYSKGNSLLFFSDKDFRWPEGQLTWPAICDWHYRAGSRNRSPRLILNYYDEHQEKRETELLLNQFEIDRVDLLLLLAHFKGRYGQQESGKP